MSQVKEFIFIFIIISVGFTASAAGLNPQVRFCRAAANAVDNNDPSLHFYSLKLKNGDEVPFCEFDSASVGYKTLFDQVQDQILTLAIQNYWSTLSCQSKTTPCFICDLSVGCEELSLTRVYDDGQNQTVNVFRFADGSFIEKESLNRGANHPFNKLLNRALAKRKISY